MFVVNLIIIFIYALLHGIKNYNNFLSIILSTVIVFILFCKIIYKGKVIYSKKNIFISIILSIFITIFTSNNLLINYNLNKIVIKNTSNKPIIIDSIYKNEKLVKINKKYISKYDNVSNANKKTEYKLYNKIDSSYKATLKAREVYVVDITNIKNVEINFQKDKIKRTISINGEKHTISKYNYSVLTAANMIVNPTYKYRYTNTSISNNIIYNIFIILLSLYLFFIIILNIISSKKNVVYLLISLIIELNSIINITFLSKIFIIFMIYILTNRILKNNCIFKEKVLYMISSILISFTFIGNRIINNSFNLSLLVIYVLTVLLIYLLIPYIINIIDNTKYCKNLTRKKIIVNRFIVFLITFLICILYLKLFSPYIVHTDTYMQLNDVFQDKYSNWHPYFHTLILKFFYIQFGNVKYFMYLRMFIYSLMINCILFYFHKKGLSLLKVYLIAVLFTMFPVTGIMLVTLVKDIDFAIALLFLTYYILLLINDKEYFKSNRVNYIFLAFSIIFTALFRHNGIYIAIFSLIIIFIYMFKNKEYILLVTIFLSISSIYIVKYPLYNLLNVEPTPRNADIAQLVHGFGYLKVENKQIDKSASEFINKDIIKDNKLVRYYDKYNIDLLLHYNEVVVRDKEFDKSKLIKFYLKQFIRTPISLIIDRLYGTDMIWNNAEDDSIREYKYQTKYSEFDTDYGDALLIKCKSNEFINNILIYIANNELLNVLFFRGGIYLDLIIITILYCIIKKKKTIICIIPIFINLVTLFLVMAHQEYRYVWVFELVALFLFLAVKYQKKIKYY